MAYAFSRVNQALGGDQEQENQDIFGGAGQPQQQGVQGQNPAGTTPQGITKTSTAGAIGAANPTSEIQTPQEASAGGAGAASKILARNESTTPTQVKELGGKLAGASTALQDEANQYVDKARNTNYNVSSGDVNELIGGGNTEGATRASKLLSGAAAPTAERFVPKAQTNFQEVSELGSEAGITNMLRRQAGARATKGELGIESALLRRDPRFQQTRSQLVGQGANLAAQRAKLLGEGDEGVTSQAQKLQAANYKSAQDALRGNLGTARAGIDSDIGARVAAENEARRALAAQGLGSNADYAKALAAAKAQYGDVEGDMTRFDKFGGEVTAADLYDEPSASRYSRISALLGEPGAVRLAGKGAGDRVSFDLNAYRSDAGELAARRERERAADLAADEAKAARLAEANRKQLEDAKAMAEANDAYAAKTALPPGGARTGTLALPSEAPPGPEGITMIGGGQSSDPLVSSGDFGGNQVGTFQLPETYGDGATVNTNNGTSQSRYETIRRLMQQGLTGGIAGGFGG